MKPNSYKLLIFLTIAAILGIFTAIPLLILNNSIENTSKSEKLTQPVDLPEEYKSLSHNSNKPDTVLAFYDNDTVYIEFKH